MGNLFVVSNIYIFVYLRVLFNHILSSSGWRKLVRPLFPCALFVYVPHGPRDCLILINFLVQNMCYLTVLRHSGALLNVQSLATSQEVWGALQ